MLMGTDTGTNMAAVESTRTAQRKDARAHTPVAIHTLMCTVILVTAEVATSATNVMAMDTPTCIFMVGWFLIVLVNYILT